MVETIEGTDKRSALSGWPMIIGWVGMMVFAFHSTTHMVGAGDTWVAMACGRHFINHGVDTVEPFSANSHKAGPTVEEVEDWPGWAQWITDKVGIETVQYWHPTGWVNQNWLTHVIFYWVTHLSPFADAEEFSFNSLVYWKIALYVAMIICVYYSGRVLGVDPALSAFFACFALFVGRSFFDVRPAGFSNLMVALYFLILVLTTYRNVLYIWFIVPIIVFWCNVHGGYLYMFIALVPFIGINFLTSFTKKGFVSIGLKGVYHAVGAGAAAFVAMILFNPFHLTNLTHTFVISLSPHAEKWREVNEWHPAFEWNNPVGDEIPFLIMYIIAWIVLAVWIITTIVTRQSVGSRMDKRRKEEEGDYQWPKVDLSLVVIVALTIYMAIRSRRFITISAAVACPVIALFINQIIRSISVSYNFRKNNLLAVGKMGKKVRCGIITAGTLAVLFFGVWWGWKFKVVYLDEWPTDAKFKSVFMRMTASDAKPFYALEFISENNLEGKMFNYWTEGGFIAWGQVPDPNTGKTPLQLFMDGRAQAAYQRKDYDRWTEIMSGGPTVPAARMRKRRLNSSDYLKIGKWIDKRLKKNDVWVVLMPTKEFNSPLTKGVERHPDWQLAFENNRQKLFIDITSTRGMELLKKIFEGQVKYPDEFSENLMMAHNIFLYSKGADSKKQGFSYAVKAFVARPSQAAMLKILKAERFPELKEGVVKFCQGYTEEFERQKEQWAREDGYHNKIVAAMIGLDYLRGVASRGNDRKLADYYKTKKIEYEKERNLLFKSKRW